MKDKILLISTIVLIIIFPLSFLFEKNNNKRETFQTALLNPKNTETLKEINISDKISDITLFKENSLWKGKILINSEETIFPLDIATINNFIKSLSEIRKLEKISENQKLINENNYEYKISYLLENSTETNIYFGKNDISQTKRIIKFNSNKESYHVNSDFEAFLSCNPDFWICPELIPSINNLTIKPENLQRITYYTLSDKITILPGSESFSKNAEKLLSLRHGHIRKEKINNNLPSEKLVIETDSGLISIKLQAFQDDYLLEYNQENNNYTTEISSWTYSALEEIFKL